MEFRHAWIKQWADVALGADQPVVAARTIHLMRDSSVFAWPRSK